MRIAANVGVLDEVELIGRCVDHLRAIGVDHIVVTDVGSTDGTREVLRARRGPDLRVIELGRDEDPWGFPERMYELTVSTLGVDRVLTLDADEFWLPRTGRLADAAGLLASDVLVVPRFNVPVVAGQSLPPASLSPAAYGEVFLVVDPIAPAQRKPDDPSFAWIMNSIMPKVVVDPRAIGGLLVGGHDVLPREGVTATRRQSEDVVIAHVPFSTYARFRRKIDNVARSLAHFGHRMGPGMAWHWRRWLEVGRAEGLEAEFQRQCLSEEQFHDALNRGTIRSVREWLSKVP